MFRIIALIILFYFIFRFLGRIFMPFLRQERPSTTNRQNARDLRREGDVRVEFTDSEAAKRRKKDTGEGEYVDFEELD